MKVVLIGRTNVGKSSLFNRLIGEKKSIISPVAGTTRDRNTGICRWQGLEFELIDTGGLDIKKISEIEKNILLQTQLAVETADLILVVLDAQTAIQKEDRQMLKSLQHQKKPYLIVVNKSDNSSLRQKAMSEFGILGKSIFPVSSVNGIGTGDLTDEIVVQLSQTLAFKQAAVKQPEILTKIAIVGRPNVGKSSLLNALLGQEFVIVSDIPHTTREPQDTLISHQDKLILLVDTAGIRKKSKIGFSGIEKESVEKSLYALKTSDIAFLLLEADQPTTSQDKHIASEIVKAGPSVIIVFNKWDKLPLAQRVPKNFQRRVLTDLPFLKWAPSRFISAKTKRNVSSLLDLAVELNEERHRQIDDDTLDKFLKASIRSHKPTASFGPQPPRLLGLRQLNTRPPYFELIADREKTVPEPYLRFIENGLRAKFGFIGTPIKIKVRGLR